MTETQHLDSLIAPEPPPPPPPAGNLMMIESVPPEDVTVEESSDEEASNDTSPRRQVSEERFQLEILGGSGERRYRALRPEADAMPWGTLDLSEHSSELMLAARRSWTAAAFQEHRTGAACAETLRCMIEARAPLDLVAVASRFALDEMVHVELCARMAMELGGGTEIII